MSDSIIQVENLSKRYTLAHQGSGNRGLRHVVNDFISAPFRRRKHESPSGKSTEDFWALKDLSFEVNRGDVVGIIGRNGAGKSTLLKILSRITEPTSGKVVLSGRVASLLEVGTGFHPELTGRENIFLNGAILGMARQEIRRKFDDIVAFSGVDKFIDTPVKRYSSGMYVRLAFAVAAHLEPEILLIDEVLAVGDAEFQKKCLGKMQDVAAKEGRTVLFISHNMGAISVLTRRAIYLRSGQIEMIGDTPSIVARYLADSYQMTSEWVATRQTSHPLQILAVRLFDKTGKSGTEFEASHGFILELEYEVREIIKNTLVEAFICTADGTHLVTLGDHDRDPFVLEQRMPGRYRVQIDVPGNWLNLGTYYVRINSGVGAYETYDLEETLSFAMVENEERTSRFGRGGCLVPMLPWRVIEKLPLSKNELILP